MFKKIKNKYIKLIPQIIIPVFITIALIKILNLNLNKVLFNLNINNEFTVIVLILLFIQLLLASLRFKLIYELLSSERTDTCDFILLTTIGTFVGFIGLSALNDIFRSFYIKYKISKLNFKSSFIYTYFDRFFSFLLFVPISLIIYTFFETSVRIKIFLFLILLLIIYILKIIFVKSLKTIKSNTGKNKINNLKYNYISDYNFFKISVLGIVAHVTQFLSLYIYIKSFNLEDKTNNILDNYINLFDSIILSFITNLPISVGGIGTRELYLKLTNNNLTDNKLFLFSDYMISYNILFAMSSFILLILIILIKRIPRKI